MARYTGPKTKIARKLGEPIFGEDKYFEKKNYPPGQQSSCNCSRPVSITSFIVWVSPPHALLLVSSYSTVTSLSMARL